MDFTPAASNVIKLHGIDLVLSANHQVGSKATITVTKDTGFDSSESASMFIYRQKHSSIHTFSNDHHAFKSSASCITNPGDCPLFVVELSVPNDARFGDLHIASTGYNSISTAASSDALIFAPNSHFNVTVELKHTNALTKVHQRLTEQFANMPGHFAHRHSTAASVLSHQQSSLKDFIGETVVRKEGNSNVSSTSRDLCTNYLNAHKTYCHINGSQPADLKMKCGEHILQTRCLKVSIECTPATNAFICVLSTRVNEMREANLILKKLPNESPLDWYATTLCNSPVLFDVRRAIGTSVGATLLSPA
jgi:hypothetical protein